MAKKKKILASLLAVGLFSSLLIGCSSSKVERIKASSAEEALELFNKYNTEDDIENMVSLYSDVYMDAIGYDTSAVVKLLKSNRDGVDITTSETTSLEDIDENTKKAIIESTALKDGEEEKDTYTYAVVKEDNGWAISPDGVLSFDDYDAPEIDKSALNMYLSKTINLFEGTILRVEVYNYTSNQYQFGIDNDYSSVIVETTEGTYTTSMEEIAELDKKVQTYFTARVDDLEGEIEKVTITNIYSKDDDGNVVEDSQKDVVVYKK